MLRSLRFIKQGGYLRKSACCRMSADRWHSLDSRGEFPGQSPIIGPPECGVGGTKAMSGCFLPSNGSTAMATIRYEIVEHDGGWAYKVDDVFSEAFATHADALAAAEIAARHHELPGSTEEIEFQDTDGRWHEQVASGFDRPHTKVVDTPEERNVGERPSAAEPRSSLQTFLLLAGLGLAIGYFVRRH
ncbi:hypothetical protein GOC91_21700 [Sinorhizobium medicae]|uniref:DUF2188 domain-containing protein n=3 Tax=Sinorhizobium medicae TaxID=110321 RepID=A0A6G1WLR9_9HYPH|nr:hypothetical protein [Sinorhizobium medicae]MDX0412347.1 hypothetical protein [Sinorhizobium medicae]MDX0418509.1 hypothetical protein [Sinorhizobium medicae]MDX0424885.1 hypothetical protein [Sinorhizobium medicae]MDX0437331.1 hypothetical protein [Sinorhizobium medicae]